MSIKKYKVTLKRDEKLFYVDENNGSKIYQTFIKGNVYEVEFVEYKYCGMIYQGNFYPYVLKFYTCFEKIQEINDNQEILTVLEDILWKNICKFKTNLDFTTTIRDCYIYFSYSNIAMYLVDCKFNIYDKNEKLIHKSNDFEQSFNILLALLNKITISQIVINTKDYKELLEKEVK